MKNWKSTTPFFRNKEFLNSLNSGLFSSQQSDTPIQKDDVHYKNENSDKNLCNACLMKPKDGIFNHGNTSHVYCCYTCAKRIWRIKSRCPVCNRKVRYVTKMVAV